MERVRLIIRQIDEAKRFILDGSVISLRLAMILLDNAGELIMSRELQSRFAFDDLWRRSNEDNSYTDQERSNAERFFDDKVRLLGRMDMLSKDQANILISCHQFRGEMFHAEHIREPVLLPATVLLFHTVLDLYSQMPPRTYMYPSPNDEQYLEFLQRLGLTKPFRLGENFLEAIVAAVRTGISLESEELPKALSGDLTERIQLATEGLFYVSEGNSEKEVDHNLRYHQFWRSIGYKLAEQTFDRSKLDAAFNEWNSQGGARFTLRKLKNWLRTSQLLAQCSPPDALRHYCGVDKKFRPFEDDIQRAVFEYDEWINAQVKDRRRR